MKLFKNIQRTRLVLGVAALFALAPLAHAESDLGSPAETAQIVSEDYKGLVERAFPRFDGDVLGRRIATIRRAYPEGYDTVTVRKIGDLESLLGLPHSALTGGDFVATTEGTYGISATSGRIHFARNVDELPPMAFDDAQRAQREIEARHAGLLAKVGIDAKQVLFANTGILSLRSQERGAPEESAKLQADAVFTYALREIDGLQVEGSEAKLASRSDGELVNLSLRWPAMRVHPELTDFSLKSTDELKREVLAHVETSANRSPVSVRMAVVLRPVKARTGQVFVPSLKVGVMPKEEAGEVFYIDLPRQQLAYDEGEVTDK